MLGPAYFLHAPGVAQYTRDNAATKKIDEAINEHYLATDFDKAEQVLTGTITACGDKCSPPVIARAWMYVGIVRGSGKNDQAGAKEAFQKALATDPATKLDVQLATPETQKTFNDLGGAGVAAVAAAPAAANDDAGDKGGLKCTPDVRELQTLRPIPLECTSDEEVASMEIRYKSFGSNEWKVVKMKKVGDAFRGEVPCDANGLCRHPQALRARQRCGRRGRGFFRFQSRAGRVRRERRQQSHPAQLPG